MVKFYKTWPVRLVCGLLLLFCFTSLSHAQIFAPEGLNIPGDWNGWTNPPAANSPFGSEFQVSGGGVKLITAGQRRWQTTFTGVTGGGFKFTSGGGNPWGNEWGGVNVTLNTLQTYSRPAPGNNNITTNASKYYTMNWHDVGYTGSTRAIFMETTNAPVTISSVTQSPVAGSVTPSNSVTVTVNTSAAPSPEEIVYVRWSTDNFVTSTLETASMTGSSGTAVIPSQADGTIVQYYAMTSTVSGITGDYDLQTINAGAVNTYTSALGGPVGITFLVDMANEAVSPNGVHVAGTFNGFNTASHALSLISGTTYGVTIPIAQNATIQYKFLNGNTSGDYESVPGACNVTGNRQFTVGTGPATIPVHCFSSCSACPPKVAVKFQVNMAGLTVSPNGVHLAGSFGSTYPTWNPGGISLTHEGGGIYSTTLQLIPGQVVPYKFINGNSWGSDEGVPGGCSVSGNRQITVPGSNFNVPVNCFGTCSNCVNVTFQVDMTGLTISPNGVRVAGAFQNWNPGSTALNYSGTGGIYTVSVNVDPNSTSEYKFLNGNTWGSDESVPGICNSNGNRIFSVGTTSKVLPVVCFGRCISCTATNEWRGLNSNFSDGANWTAGVAPNNCNFNIAIKNTPVQPSLNGGTFSTGAAVFSPGASLNIANGATLNVCGNLTGSASSVGGQGTLVLNGSAAQTIAGSLQVSNMRVENTNGVSLGAGASVAISNSLKLQSGFLNTTGGSLTLLAGPTSEARLLKVETGSGITGNITYQKYLAGLNATPDGGWYYLGSPVSGFSLGSFNQGGNTFHPATFEPTWTDPGSLYLYSQNAGSSFDDFGWSKPANASTAVSTGQGVRVWVKKSIQNGILRYTGTPITGNQSLPVSYCTSGCSYPAGGSANGWNFVSNPYACTVSWNAATGWTKTGIAGNTMYIWNAQSGTYSTYDGAIGLNGGSEFISGGQSFFVRATGGGSSLSINEDAKSNTYTSGMRANVVAPSGLRIALQTPYGKDEAWLDITEGRKTHSSDKLYQPGLNLSLGNGLSIAGIDLFAGENAIPLGLRNASGSLTFSFIKEGENWSSYHVYIRDMVEGTLQEISGDEQNVTFSASGADADRFSLVVTQTVLSRAEMVGFQGTLVWPNPTKSVLMVRKDLAGTSYSIRSVTGQLLESGRLAEGQSSLNLEKHPSGAYLIQFPEAGKTVRFNKL